MTSWTKKLSNLDLFKRRKHGGLSLTPTREAESSTITSTFSKRLHLFDQTFVPSRLGKSETDLCVRGSSSHYRLVDHDELEDNLTRNCRQFYERRVRLAQRAAAAAAAAAATTSTAPQSSAKIVASGQSSPSSACSSGYFSLNNTPLVLSPTEIDFTTNNVRKDSGCDEGFEQEQHTDSLQTKITFLRQQLLDLINQDNDLFKQLLTLNDTIVELKENKSRVTQSNRRSNSSFKSVKKISQKAFSVANLLSEEATDSSFDEDVDESDTDQEGDDDDDEQEISDLLDEAFDQQLQQDEEDLVNMTSVNRSQSVMVKSTAFRRQRVSFPATARNRRGRGGVPVATPPVRRELFLPSSKPDDNPGFYTLPTSLSKLKKKRHQQAQSEAELDHKSTLKFAPPSGPPPIPPPRTVFKQRSKFEVLSERHHHHHQHHHHQEGSDLVNKSSSDGRVSLQLHPDKPRHYKQGSFDSGMAVSDSTSEANSDVS